MPSAEILRHIGEAQHEICEPGRIAFSVVLYVLPDQCALPDRGPLRDAVPKVGVSLLDMAGETDIGLGRAEDALCFQRPVVDPRSGANLA